MPELITDEQQEALDRLSTYPHPFYAHQMRPEEATGEYPEDIPLEGPWTQGTCAAPPARPGRSAR